MSKKWKAFSRKGRYNVKWTLVNEFLICNNMPSGPDLENSLKVDFDYKFKKNRPVKKGCKVDKKAKWIAIDLNKKKNHDISGVCRRDALHRVSWIEAKIRKYLAGFLFYSPWRRKLWKIDFVNH